MSETFISKSSTQKPLSLSFSDSKKRLLLFLYSSAFVLECDSPFLVVSVMGRVSQRAFRNTHRAYSERPVPDIQKRIKVSVPKLIHGSS